MYIWITYISGGMVKDDDTNLCFPESQEGDPWQRCPSDLCCGGSPQMMDYPVYSGSGG